MVAVHAGASTELFIVQCTRGEESSPGRVERSSRAMLATARPYCTNLLDSILKFAIKLEHLLLN